MKYYGICASYSYCKIYLTCIGLQFVWWLRGSRSYKLYYILLFPLIKVKPFNHPYQPIAYQCRQGEVKHWFMPIPSNNASNPLFFQSSKIACCCVSVCTNIYCKLFKLNQSLNETKATLNNWALHYSVLQACV